MICCFWVPFFWLIWYKVLCRRLSSHIWWNVTMPLCSSVVGNPGAHVGLGDWWASLWGDHSLVFSPRSPKVSSDRYSRAVQFLQRIESRSSDRLPKDRCLASGGESGAGSPVRLQILALSVVLRASSLPSPLSGFPSSLSGKQTSCQSPVRLGKGYSSVGIWAKTTSRYIDFQNPPPPPSSAPIPLASLPPFLSHAPPPHLLLLCCRVDQLPPSRYPLPSDI